MCATTSHLFISINSRDQGALLFCGEMLWFCETRWGLLIKRLSWGRRAGHLDSTKSTCPTVLNCFLSDDREWVGARAHINKLMAHGVREVGRGGDLGICMKLCGTSELGPRKSAGQQKSNCSLDFTKAVDSQNL